MRSKIKKQTGKRLGISLLSGIMFINIMVPALADSDEDGPYTIPKLQSYSTKSTAEYSEAQLADSWVEFGEIDFLVRHYNNTVISNRYTYNSLRDAYERAEESGSVSSPTGGYKDADNSMDDALKQLDKGISGYQNSIRQLYAQMDSMTSEAERLAAQNQISALQNTLATLEVQRGYIQSIQEVNTTMSDMMGSMANGSGMSSSDLTNYYLQFSEVEATMVKAAQSMYPTYYQLVYNMDQLNANLAVAETAYQGTLVQKELGMCTDNDVADALYNVTSIKNSITSLENQMVSLKQEFCKLVGKDFNEDITFGELPEVDYEYIASIDLYQDIDRALSKNYSVRNKQNVMNNNNGPGSTYESRKSDLYSLNAERDNVRTEVNAAYLEIQTKMTELTMAEEKLANAERQIKQVEEQYNLGLISRLEYEQKKLSYISEETACKTAESALLDAVNTYKWAVQGL